MYDAVIIGGGAVGKDNDITEDDLMQFAKQAAR